MFFHRCRFMIFDLIFAFLTDSSLTVLLIVKVLECITHIFISFTNCRAKLWSKIVIIIIVWIIWWFSLMRGISIFNRRLRNLCSAEVLIVNIVIIMIVCLLLGFDAKNWEIIILIFKLYSLLRIGDRVSVFVLVLTCIMFFHTKICILKRIFFFLHKSLA